MTNTYTCIKII